MIFNDHSKLKGSHALLSPSQSAWLRYSEDQLFQKYKSLYAASIGTIMHGLAEELITQNIKLTKSDKKLVLVELLKNRIPRNVIELDRMYGNFMSYVNDAIGYRLTPEQIVWYSDECYGTADALSFNHNFLRIHDYKSGVKEAKMEQLLNYAALFCLEYKIDPNELDGCELRLYQNDEIVVHNPHPDEIKEHMDIIVDSVKIVKKLKEEA